MRTVVDPERNGKRIANLERRFAMVQDSLEKEQANRLAAQAKMTLAYKDLTELVQRLTDIIKRG